MMEFTKFGTALKDLRKRVQEPKVELCMTLEIDEEFLDLLESGAVQPSEDIVDQLIAHFDLDDQAAQNMWKIAGYPDVVDVIEQTVPVFVPLHDLKITYTDLLHVTVSNHGVVLNFMQGSTPGLPPIVVSRLGMSREHAVSVLEVMSTALKKSLDQERATKDKKPRQLGTGE
jgi:hypothetical protein